MTLKPDSLGSVRKLFNQIQVHTGTGDVQGQPGLVFAAAGRGNVTGVRRIVIDFPLSFIGAVTRDSIERDRPAPRAPAKSCSAAFAARYSKRRFGSPSGAINGMEGSIRLSGIYEGASRCSLLTSISYSKQYDKNPHSHRIKAA